MARFTYEDLTGQIINGRKVLSLDIARSRNRNRNIYVCECILCGNISHYTACRIHKLIECYRCPRKGKESPFWKGVGDLPGSIYCSYRIGAKNTKHIFDVSIQDLWDQFLKQNKKCPYTGIDLTFEPLNLSLDRTDSSGHYTKDNVQFVFGVINSMKWALSNSDFITLCQKVSEPNITNYTFDLSKSNYKVIHGQYFSQISPRGRNPNTKRRKIFTVTKDHLYDQMVLQNGKCAYTGEKLIIDYDRKLNTASLDRIDSSVGYIVGNIQWVEKNVNKAKYTLSDQDFRKICNQIWKHCKIQ